MQSGSRGAGLWSRRSRGQVPSLTLAKALQGIASRARRLQGVLGRGANLASVPYTAREARQELLDTLGDAVDEIAVALAALGGAYEQLTTLPAERLEEELFRPVQAAYRRAKRTHARFAQRQGLPRPAFSSSEPGPPPTRLQGVVGKAPRSAR